VEPAVDAVEVLGVIDEIVLDVIAAADPGDVLGVIEEAVLGDVVAAVDGPGDVLGGTEVEIVAPKLPRDTISLFRGTWNRPIPESQQSVV
jgi:hypothetical protein